MPNHFHVIIIFTDTPKFKSTGKEIDLSHIIAMFKSKSTNLIRKTGRRSHSPTKQTPSIWQKSFFDHVIRDEKDLQRIREYIFNNLINWELDEYFIRKCFLFQTKPQIISRNRLFWTILYFYFRSFGVVVMYPENFSKTDKPEKVTLSIEEAAVAKKPKDVWALLKLANNYIYEAEDSSIGGAKAKKVLKWILKLEPNNPDAKQLMAEILINENQVKKGVRLMEEIHEPTPNNPDLLLQTGKAFIKKGKNKKERFKGEVLLDRAFVISLDQGKIKTACDIAVIFAENGKYERAKKYLSKTTLIERDFDYILETHELIEFYNPVDYKVDKIGENLRSNNRNFEKSLKQVENLMTEHPDNQNLIKLQQTCQSMIKNSRT